MYNRKNIFYSPCNKTGSWLKEKSGEEDFFPGRLKLHLLLNRSENKIHIRIAVFLINFKSTSYQNLWGTKQSLREALKSCISKNERLKIKELNVGRKRLGKAIKKNQKAEENNTG